MLQILGKIWVKYLESTDEWYVSMTAYENNTPEYPTEAVPSCEADPVIQKQMYSRAMYKTPVNKTLQIVKYINCEVPNCVSNMGPEESVVRQFRGVEKNLHTEL